jgi:hypothetical protein
LVELKAEWHTLDIFATYKVLITFFGSDDMKMF